MRRRWFGSPCGGLLLALGLAGCGATTSVHTTIAPDGSGTIVWTVSDSAGDIQTNGGMTPAQVTTLLQKNAPPGAAVSGPVPQNGQDVWAITDHFSSIRQLNTILQAATGSRHFSPVTMHATGTPWAMTYRIADPDNGSGYQWHWVTQALQKAGNSQAGDWMSGSSADTLTVPWTVPSGAPSYAAVVNHLGQAPGFGVVWFPPSYALTLRPVLGSRPSLHATWTMRFSRDLWRKMPARQRTAIQTWWKATDPHASFHLQHGSPSWSASLAMSPGKDAPWGTMVTRTTGLKPTFWYHRATTRIFLTPASQWLTPPAWTAAGLTTRHGWTGPVTIAAVHDAAPLLGRVLRQSTGWNGADWAASITWQSLRWGHVAEVGGGSVAAVGLAGLGLWTMRRRRRSLISCRQCGGKNPPSTRFCTRCGRPLDRSEASETDGAS